MSICPTHNGAEGGRLDAPVQALIQCGILSTRRDRSAQSAANEKGGSNEILI
jgi:IS5 family transposase